ncbi:MAG: hypothetical protein XD85_0528 [Parcubacteria bacterium 34_609]|nr:MAG: hypothetical protein XD85_0528 [Parcubacteria bacterium 34_609]KUK97345.1 MAG: hypothetical protein XE08_0712 [Parcubacteria bacterium 32_520]
MDILHILRAVLFGVAVGYSISFFFKYFKPITENLLGKETINIDLWWWSGITISVILGILAMLILL